MVELARICIWITFAFVLLVSLAGIVKLTSTTAHHRRCVTTAPVKTVSTTSLVSVTMGSQEGSVMKILTIVKVINVKMELNALTALRSTHANAPEVLRAHCAVTTPTIVLQPCA